MNAKTRVKALILGLLFAPTSYKTTASILTIPQLQIFGKKQNTSPDRESVQMVEQYLANFNRLSHSDDSIQYAFPYAKNAYEISGEIGYFKGIAYSSYHLAQHYSYFGKNSQAIEYNFISLKYADKIGDHYLTGRCYQSIGLFYFSQKKWDKAKYNFQMCINESRLLKDPDASITPVYLLALCNLETGLIDNAVMTLQKIKSQAIKDGDSMMMLQTTNYLGRAAYHKGEYEKALELLTQGIDFLKSRHEWLGLAQSYAYITEIYIKTGNLEMARKFIDDAYSISLTVPKNFIRMDVTRLIGEVYNKIGKYQEAYHFLKEHMDFKDSIFVNDVSSQVAIARSNMEFEKKEAVYQSELKENERKKKFYILVAAILASFVIVILFAYRGIRNARRESEKLLLNILPKETAQELKKHGRAIPKLHPNATIMFCDVERFTVVSENMTPSTLVNMLDEYFSGFDSIMEKHHIEKIKTIGDAYMCASGIREGQDDHAQAMVSAALEIMAYLKKSAAAMVEKYGQHLNFRIGIHSGEVVSGVVGKKKYAYDIWGDTVNVAARMEQNSKPGEINITGVTLALLGDRFKVIPRGQIEAKNKGLLEMYFVKPSDSDT